MDGGGLGPAIANALEGILWVLRTGARWRDMPEEFPDGSTCWRRLRGWEEQDVWLKAWRKLLSMLDQRRLLDWEEAFLDATFITAKLRNRRFEDKRKSRRYRKRWTIERTNAWLQNFRHIQVRYDRILTVFQGFFHCTCFIIALRHLCNQL